MAEYELVINYDKCTGCCLCEMVCSMHLGSEIDPQKSMIRIVKLAGEASVISIPVNCLQCEKPICEVICPASAISTSPKTGARVIDKGKCIGCSACIYACPFGAIVLNRSVGTAFVCDLCDGAPLCVRFCPFGALQYIRSDEVSIRLKRARSDKFVGFLKLSPMSSE